MKLRVLLFCLASAAAGSCDLTPASACQLPEAQQEEDTAKRQRTQELIQQHFPNLDQNSVNGWVDSYSAMGERELIQLLQQRKLMGKGGSGFGDLKLNLPKFDLGTSSKLTPAMAEQTQSRGTAIAEGLAIVDRNQFAQKVAGHRCEDFCFAFSGAPDSKLNDLIINKWWNFKPGTLQTTVRSLDLCVIDDGRAMFRLEPGCVLTRCGRFTRLEDGRLGQVVGGKPLAVFPEVRVPESVKVVEVEQADGDQTTKRPQNEIQCVRILDASLLTSSNGVYFTVAEKDRTIAFEPADRVDIRSGMLELSNFDLQQQHSLQDSLQDMIEAMPLRR